MERVSLGRTASPAHWNVLTRDEQIEALAYRRPDDMLRFVTGRALLRNVLAAECSLDPTAVQLTRGDDRRPVLTMGGASPPPYFSVSHAGEWIAVALAPIPVGVDVERIGGVELDIGLLEAVCTSRERRILLSLPTVRRTQYFTRLWTRKEAVVKASGDRRLDLIDVSRTRVRGTSGTEQWRARNEPCCGQGYEFAWATTRTSRLQVNACCAPSAAPTP